MIRSCGLSSTFKAMAVLRCRFSRVRSLQLMRMSVGFGRVRRADAFCRCGGNPFRLRLTLGKRAGAVRKSAVIINGCLRTAAMTKMPSRRHRRRRWDAGRAASDSCFVRGLVPPSAGPRSKKIGIASTPISHQKGMKMSGIVLSAVGSPEPALAAVDRRAARHHPKRPRHRQQGQLGARQPDQLLHRAGPQQPRQRHLQSARRHRQRRAGAAGRQHRHHLAAEPGRQRQVDRQPGAAEPGRLLDQVQRDLDRDHRRDRRPTCSAPTNNTVTGTAVLNNLGTPVAITAATKLVSAATSTRSRRRPPTDRPLPSTARASPSARHRRP